MAFYHPEMVAGIMRTVLVEGAENIEPDIDDAEKTIPAPMKVAIAAISLGQDHSARVLKYLNERGSQKSAIWCDDYIPRTAINEWARAN